MYFLDKMAAGLKIDPTKLDCCDNILQAATREIYKKRWLQCVEWTGMSEDKPPTADMFFGWFKHIRIQNNYSGNSMHSIYSAISKIYRRLYHRQLSVSFKV